MRKKASAEGVENYNKSLSFFIFEIDAVQTLGLLIFSLSSFLILCYLQAGKFQQQQND